MRIIIKKSLSVLLLFIMFTGLEVAAMERTKVVRLHVDGMISPSCPVLLKQAVNKIEGVTHVQASLQEHSAQIKFDSNLTSIEAIQAVIKKKVGFNTKISN